MAGKQANPHTASDEIILRSTPESSSLQERQEHSRVLPETQRGSTTSVPLPDSWMNQIADLVALAVDQRLKAAGFTPDKPSNQLENPPSGAGNKKPDTAPKTGPKTSMGIPHQRETLSKTQEKPQEEDNTYTESEDKSYVPEEQEDTETTSKMTSIIKRQQELLKKKEQEAAELLKELENLRKAQTHLTSGKVSTSEEQDKASQAPQTQTPRSKGIEKHQGYVNHASPFSEDIQLDPLPKSFRQVSCEYDGKSDPDEHLMRFENIAQLHQYSEGVKCRVFLTTLAGPAQQWFRQLPPNSIHYFEDLRRMFTHQFASAKRSMRSSLYLLTVKQESGETLRDYLTRFNAAVLETPMVDSAIKVHALTQGLKYGPFYESLVKKQPTSFEELLARTEKYIHLEDAKLARKAENASQQRKERGEDRKETPGDRKSRDRNDRQRVRGDRTDSRYTPLTREPADLLEIVVKKPGVTLPPGAKDPPRNPVSDKFCKFHNDYGHHTNDCRNLKAAIERLVREGQLAEYVRRETNRSRRERPDEKGAQEERQPEKNQRTDDQGAKQKRTINMIYGGPTDGDSHRARKASVRSAMAWDSQGVLKIEASAQPKEISFGPKDDRPMVRPHDDALVITADIENFDVKRIFVDTGSAVNVIFKSCYAKMGLSYPLKPVTTSLHGFAGDMVTPLGMVDLMLMLGDEKARIAKPVSFLIVDAPSAYNVILGRPALNLFQAVISTYYMKMKFPVGDITGEVWGDQITSKNCYVQAVQDGEKRKRALPDEECSKRGAGPEKKAKLTEEEAQIQPVEELMMVELFEGKQGYTTRIGTQMRHLEMQNLITCLRKNADVFAFQTSDLTGVDPEVALHCLNVDPAIKPVKQKLRQFGPEKDKIIREEVLKLLEAGHIEEVQFPQWLSNAVMVAKGNTGKWRMCIDFRDLNKACPKDHYPLPRIDQLVDSTSGCQLLSMMDAYQGYHQIKMNPADVPKAAFGVCAGTFGFKSMPFGLKNAGATYQRMMDKVFRNQIGRNMEVYVDDMLVKSLKAEDHTADLHEVFGVIRAYKLKLNPAKCAFGVQSGKFLGYMVTPKGIEVNGEKVKAVLAMDPPKNIKEIQKLNGRITALSRFIARSAEKSLPFFRILRRKARFEWTQECQKAFEELKSHLTQLPLLTKPIPGETLYLYIAVGEESLSAVLLREEGSHQKPIYYVSKMLQGPELRYPDIEKSALAVMTAARKLRPYFLSHKVVVRTNELLKQVLGKPDLSGRMVKWAIELSEYDVEFEPRTAIKGQALADFIQETSRTKANTPVVWKAYVDGSVTKEGAGVGIHITSPEGVEHSFAIKLNFQVSNNEAEYEALVRAMKILTDLGAAEVLLFSDSQLVTQQVLGTYEKKEERMMSYFKEVEMLKEKFANFELYQIPREENEAADRLARIASSAEGTWEGGIVLLNADAKTAVAEINAIEEIPDWRTPVIRYLNTGELPEMPGALKKAALVRFFLVGGHLYKRSFTNPFLRCLSEAEGEYILREIHEGCAGAHSGYKDLIRKTLRAGYFWPTMMADAQNLVRRCESCQKQARLIHTPAETLGVMYSSCPFDKWGIDIVGKLPTAPGGKVYLIVAVDYFTKWVEAEAVVKITEVAVRNFLWKNICCRFGIPRILVSDNGTQFTGAVVTSWCTEMNVEQRFVSVAHPQANGQVEVTNRTLLDGIRARLDKAKGNWVEELPSVLWAYRTSPKTATGESPFTLVYGAHALVPAEVGVMTHRVLNYDESKNADLRKEDLDLVEEIREKARVRSERYKKQIQNAYNKRVQVRKFEKGDLVLKRADALKPTGKLDANWEGPYIIAEVLRGGAYELIDSEGRHLPRPWNVNNLKKFYA